MGEAMVLGLASGPSCIASCGPVLIPSLLSESSGVRVHFRYLSFFLASRLLGYLVFAAAAWELRSLVTLPAHNRAWILAVVYISLAFSLLWYAGSAKPACADSCLHSKLVTIGPVRRSPVPAASLLGFLTGVSLCPPFIAAGVRAASAAHLLGALLFFAMFFVGTSIWFVPFVGFSAIRRNEAVNTVARMTMVLVALFYGFSGLMNLIG